MTLGFIVEGIKKMKIYADRVFHPKGMECCLFII